MLKNSTSNGPTLAGQPDSIFPFDTKSLLKMCWGMTLNFSHEPQQQALGALFNAQFEQLLKNSENDSLNGDFLRNLTLALSSSVRNLGFIRATHVEYLDFNGDRLSKRRENIEQIADYASFSGSGLSSKLGSFIGFGSVADLVTGLHLSVIYIPIFAVGGIIGAVAVTFFARLYVNATDSKWDNQMKSEQNAYWKTHYKKDVTDELYNLYISIKELIERFYPNEKSSIMARDGLLNLQDKSESESTIKSIISDQVLPPDDLQWFPIVAAQQGSQQASPKSAKNQSKASQPAALAPHS